MSGLTDGPINSFPSHLPCRAEVPDLGRSATFVQSWIREWELSEACLFIPKGRFHLLLFITIVLDTTRGI
jgi:hypothetical protein